jgi:hypothetical protein
MSPSLRLPDGHSVRLVVEEFLSRAFSHHDHGVFAP